MDRWNDSNLKIIKYPEPDENYYHDELEKIDKSLSKFCEIARIDETKVKVNIKSLRQVIKRVDKRQLYFHIYHNGMKANEFKVITGLTVFWILKLKPFWYDIDPNESIDDEMIDFAAMINEKFALHLVISLLEEYNYDFIEKGEDLVTAYCDELIYSFRYRDLSKESLFLMFDPFYYLYFYDDSHKL